MNFTVNKIILKIGFFILHKQNPQYTRHNICNKEYFLCLVIFLVYKKSLNVKYKLLRETELEHTKKIFTYNRHNFTTQIK